MTCNIRQSKQKRFAILPQVDCKTFNTSILGGGIALPVKDSFSVSMNRGGLIARGDVIDGRPHQIAGVMGSNGYSISGECEMWILPDNATVDYPAWAILMMACGMEGELDSVENTITLIPSVKPPATSTLVGDSDPVALSGVFYAAGNSDGDFRHLIRSMSGTWTMNLNAGERATLGFEMLGLIEEDSGNVARRAGNMLTASGFQASQGSQALVVRGITASIPDDLYSNPVALSSLSISYNAGVSDVPDATEKWGFAYSKPILADAPTIEFNLSIEAGVNDTYFWNQYISAGTIAIEVVLDTGVAGRFVKIKLPAVQLNPPSLEAADGRDTYGISGSCVRTGVDASNNTIEISWIAPSEV